MLHHHEWSVIIEAEVPIFHPPAWSGAPPGRNIVHRPDLVGVIPPPRRDVEGVSLDVGVRPCPEGTALIH